MAVSQSEAENCFRWVNAHSGKPPVDCWEQLADGVVLARVVEAIAGAQLRSIHRSPTTQFHRQQNWSVLLAFVAERYGTALTFDVGELTRCNTRELLALCFFIQAKSGTRVDTRREHRALDTKLFPLHTNHTPKAFSLCELAPSTPHHQSHVSQSVHSDATDSCEPEDVDSVPLESCSCECPTTEHTQVYIDDSSVEKEVIPETETTTIQEQDEGCGDDQELLKEQSTTPNESDVMPLDQNQEENRDETRNETEIKEILVEGETNSPQQEQDGQQEQNEEHDSEQLSQTIPQLLSPDQFSENELYEPSQEIDTHPQCNQDSQLYEHCDELKDESLVFNEENENQEKDQVNDLVDIEQETFVQDNAEIEHVENEMMVETQEPQPIVLEHKMEQQETMQQEVEQDENNESEHDQDEVDQETLNENEQFPKQELHELGELEEHSSQLIQEQSDHFDQEQYQKQDQELQELQNEETKQNNVHDQNSLETQPICKTYPLEHVLLLERYVRGVLMRKQHPVRRQLFQRKKVVDEILTTEECYVSRLQQFNAFYLDKVLEVLPNDKIIRKCKEDIQIILNYNQKMLEKLQSLQAERKVYGEGIGEVFQSLTYFLKVYCSYVNSTEAINAHEERLMRKNKTFEAVITAMKTEHKLESFNSYVILPIQRIPRYRLLLQELLKTLPPYHREYAFLSGALAKIVDVGNDLNEKKRILENQTLVLRLVNKFKCSTGKKIHQEPSRKYVRFGDLVVLENDGKQKPRGVHAFLFSDVLVLAKIGGSNTMHKTRQLVMSVEDILALKQKIVVESVVAMRNVSVFDAPTLDGCPAFAIVLANAQSITLSCLSEEDKSQWIRAFEQLAQQRHEQLMMALVKSISANVVYAEQRKHWRTMTKDVVFQTPWAGGFLVLSGQMLMAFTSARAFVAQEEPTAFFLAQYAHVGFEEPATLVVTNFASPTRERVEFAVDTPAVALLWCFFVRQVFVMVNPSQADNFEMVAWLGSGLVGVPMELLVLATQQMRTNKTCADCGKERVHYVDLDYGVFLCKECGMIHHVFPKTPQTLGICTVEAAKKRAARDGAQLMKFGNEYGNAIRDVVVDEEMSRNAVLWKKYGIQGKVFESVSTDLARKARIGRISERPMTFDPRTAARTTEDARMVTSAPSAEHVLSGDEASLSHGPNRLSARDRLSVSK